MCELIKSDNSDYNCIELMQPPEDLCYICREYLQQKFDDELCKDQLENIIIEEQDSNTDIKLNDKK